MQGALTVNRFPIRTFALVLIATAILLLGVLGGYWLRSLSAASRPAASTQPTVVSVQAGGVSAESSVTQAVPAEPALKGAHRRAFAY
jgi:hypothetical protein